MSTGDRNSSYRQNTGRKNFRNSKNSKNSKVEKSSQSSKLKSKAKYIEEIKNLEEKIQNDDFSSVEKFSELPLSNETAIGLKQSHYFNLTDIQKQAVPIALKGKDILGAAKTGSGKTLAFLVPLLELLYRKQWTQYDGLGALVLSPTRELAVQIFEVLKNIGRKHTFSAGLVIGGNDVKSEKERISKLNILIGTPGRLLQHLDQAINFDANNLQMLVLDEADRILDMGFQSALDGIIEHLPKQRQTLLFSATQTKRVKDLARLSLSNPEYISVHEESATTTPLNLSQHYIISPLQEKLNLLFSFIKSHLKSKIIVFLSSTKQVRFVFESFKRLHTGIPLMHLQGKQKQTARLEITSQFAKSKYACLFATDIVARGLDFPSVDWVIQLDAPEDIDTYIHRVGRTARFDKPGNALLFITPSEAPAMIKKLESKKIPISKLTVKDSKRIQIEPQLQNLCFKMGEIKYLAQKAFISYVKSVYLQKDKDIFKYDDIPFNEFAKSLGLSSAPAIKVKGNNAEHTKLIKNASRQLLKSLQEENEDQNDTSEGNPKAKNLPKTKYDKLFSRKNQDVLSEHYIKMIDHSSNSISKDNVSSTETNDDDQSEDDFITLKKVDHELDEKSIPDLQFSKKQIKAATSKKIKAKIGPKPTKIIYDDEGNPHSVYEFGDEKTFAEEGDSKALRESFVEKENAFMQTIDSLDKELEREKRKEKKKRKREREHEEREGKDDDEDGGYVVTLASGQDDNEFNEDNYSDEADDIKVKEGFESNKRRKHDSTSKQEYNNNDNSNSLMLETQPETLTDLEALSVKLLNG